MFLPGRAAKRPHNRYQDVGNSGKRNRELPFHSSPKLPRTRYLSPLQWQRWHQVIHSMPTRRYCCAALPHDMVIGERLISLPYATTAVSMSKNSPPDDELSFEQALARLEQIALSLEDGNLGLDESLQCYEEGVKRLKTCHRLLEQAERKIELLSGVDSEGNPITQPFDDEASTLEEKAETRSRRRSSSAPRVRKGKSTDDEEDRLDEPPRLF